MLLVGPQLVFFGVQNQQMIDKTYLFCHSYHVKTEFCKVLFPEHHSIVVAHLQVKQ